MTSISLYHNPRCSKSRETLALLQEKNHDITVIEYLKTPPSIDELTQLLALLSLNARELMRTKEVEYKQMGLDNPALTEAELIAAMVATPKLIERPIAIANGKAAIGRPPENVLGIL
jgi:arsenate reductase